MSTKLTTVEVARAFGVHVNTVRKWADEGLLPCTRTLGGARRFDPADVRAAIREAGG